MGPGGRRRGQQGPSKGDLRERAILDAAERRLGLEGFDTLTVETIASEAGISRASLYFYFGSKQEVITALVARTMQSLSTAATRTDLPTRATAGRDAAAAVRGALDVTVTAWRNHPTVMQTAVELGPVVPEIGRLWDGTVARIIETMAVVVREAQPERGGISAEDLAQALCWMTERVLYRASVDGADLQHAADVCLQVWGSTLGFTDRDH